MDKIRYTVYSRTYTLHLEGDRAEDACGACDAVEYGTHDNLEDAVAEAREIASDPESVKLIDQRGSGIGAVEHLLVYVDAFLYDEGAGEWIPCDGEGEIDDPCGPESVYYHDCLEDRSDVREAWNKAVHSKWSYLDYRADEFYTVRAFLDEVRGGHAADEGVDEAASRDL